MNKLQRLLQLFSTPGAIKGLFTWKIFSLASFQMLQRLKSAAIEPLTIIDVGANQGQFSLAASMAFPGTCIYPIEPNPAAADALCKNLPPHVAANVVVSAVGETSGSANLYIHTDSQASSLLPIGIGRKGYFPNDSITSTINVPLVSLDDLFFSRELTQPVLLKIDVQGYEDRVLAGATKLLPSIKWIVLEISFSQLYEGERTFSEVFDMMKKYNFQFLRPLDFHLSGDHAGDIIEMDALFVNLAY